MNQILKGIPRTVCYLDDVLISGKTRKECAENTVRLLEQLQKHGIRANVAKCNVFQTSVRYLGHEVSGKGLRSSKEKVEAPTLSGPDVQKAVVWLRRRNTA